MMRFLILAGGIAATAAFPARAVAQQHEHAHTIERLGTVQFDNSCAPGVSSAFNRAVALLHSFEFGESIRAFRGVLAQDSTCAMAHWGLAISHWGNPMAPGITGPELLQRGRDAARAGTRLAARATQRERDFISAAAELYEGYETRDQQTRLNAYEAAMERLATTYPDDIEARIFYALSVAASAPLTDKTYAKQLKAGALLESVLAARPDHPGIAHYIIHSYDFPPLAPRAAAAARRYADIAPSAAHALHMPSHTFTRVGLWEESATTNLRSMESARTASSLAEVFHAADYAVYAYLQMRRDSAARAIIDAMPALVRNFDIRAVTGAAPGWAGVYGLAAMPARYVLERQAWNEAAGLQLTPDRVPQADALTWFTRALGASHTRDFAAARSAIDTLASLATQLTARNEAYWAEQVAIQRLTAQAWLSLAEGRREEALRQMREAADREDATEKAAVTPGPLAPARELLGDMLMTLDRPAEALAEYRRSQQHEPNRYRSLHGAMKAAAATGDRTAAAAYQAQLARLTGTP